MEFLGIYGSVNLRSTAVSRRLVAELEATTPNDIELISEDDKAAGTFQLKFCGGAFMSSGEACQLDEDILAFGPHAVGVGRVYTTYNDETTCLLIGTPEAVAEARRQDNITAARKAMQALSLEDGEALITEMQSPAFWSEVESPKA